MARRIIQAWRLDLVVTSPPYNIRNSTGSGLKSPSGGKRFVDGGGKARSPGDTRDWLQDRLSCAA